ncbi:sugar ABC transporter, periplasmic sugar-binding protein [Catenulispora acidiphila DSM 44928]|uniref:Sugar ABC transporter, periplasmic sugar-binding protein n=1 Tax=Catenulispora acidiphila (strain DSM 44928 / JCM 14897 / NBRC 102108 / NRRL B-24433 / ID139908) TaxID=479433 RepID=C7PZQ0_CATAD|nr:substrate-binding domain-containing protein [Catenulispora acidiphila]ACU73565.1 sugar ABC transporter, periplasmic sugar-binding protein [Catenulispora acidiphila DSM 44928]
MGTSKLRITAAFAAALLVASAAACSKNASGTSAPAAGTSGASGSAAPPALAGSVTFNQDNLAKLDAALKTALAGKDLSSVNIAMVVNVAADYWKAGQVGFQKGCSDLGLSGSHCTYFAPPNGKLTEQNSEMETLRSQGITGYAISAIDPTSAAGTIHTDVQHGVSVLAIDSPLPGTDAASLYLGTPNYTAGQQAGEAMKQVLGGKGKVAVLVGSLTAANATQRIQGFEDALKGSNITVVQKVNDNLSAATATSDAETILANNPDVNGLYGVYSYDGPALAQAVQSAGKTNSVHIVSDDSDAQTLGFIKSGVISGTVVQMPYQQGYTGAYILAADKVLGKDATMAIVKPFLESDGSTLSSGVGLVTSADLSAYQALETQLGIS